MPPRTCRVRTTASAPPGGGAAAAVAVRTAGSIQWNAVAMVLSNAGAPVTVTTPGGRERPARAESLLLAAALGRLRIEGPADVLLGHLPDLDTDVRAPLLAAGHGPPAPTPPAPHHGTPAPCGPGGARQPSAGSSPVKAAAMRSQGVASSWRPCRSRVRPSIRWA